MREFAKVILDFLEETYKDAYTYHFEYNPFVSWDKCLELYVSDKTFRIRVISEKILELYKLYKNGYDNIWQEALIEAIER